MRSAQLRLPDFLNLAIVDSSRLKSRLVLPTTEFETCMLRPNSSTVIHGHLTHLPCVPAPSHIAGPNQRLLSLVSNSGGCSLPGDLVRPHAMLFDALQLLCALDAAPAVPAMHTHTMTTPQPDVSKLPPAHSPCSTTSTSSRMPDSDDRLVLKLL